LIAQLFDIAGILLDNETKKKKSKNTKNKENCERQMFKAARLEKIKTIVAEKKQVDVPSLSILLSVTEATIRSDLETLEQEGCLIRTRGGAIFKASSEKSYQDFQLFNSFKMSEEKEYIGKIAIQLINEGDSVFLGGGDTCAFIAKAMLKRKNIHAITNNVFVSNILAKHNSIDTILCGGYVSGNSMSTFGDKAIQSLDGLCINKAFFSVSGVDIVNGYTLSSIDESNLYSKVFDIAEESIIVADYNKFDSNSFVKWKSIDSAKKIISNQELSNNYKAFFFNNGIQVFTTYEIESMPL